MTRGILGIALLLGCGDAAPPSAPVLECGSAAVRLTARRAYGCREGDDVRAIVDETLRFDGRSPPRTLTCRAGRTDVLVPCPATRTVLARFVLPAGARLVADVSPPGTFAR